MKQLYAWLNSRLLKNKTLYGKLNLIFFFFFFVPVGVLIFFGIHYNILADRYLLFFFAVLLGFSFFGLNLLRKVFDEISGFSSNLSERVKTSFPEDQQRLQGGDELRKLIQSFGIIDRHLMQIQQQLARKHSEMSILRDLADLCYVTADPDEILYVTLERALALSDSDIGSIMLLERPERKRFMVRAAIGLDQWLNNNAYVDFESSIAKYAVLNKTAMIVDDVEKDTRFGRANRPHYGTKAFICLPIKTSREIIGVLTISRKDQGEPYSSELIEVLEPLLSNATFTYENLQLIGESQHKTQYLKTIAAMLDVVHSSYRGSELVHACLEQVRSALPYDLALVLQQEPGRPDELAVGDLVAAESTPLVKGDHFIVTDGSTLNRVLGGQTAFVDSEVLAEECQIDLMGDSHARQVLLAPLKTDGSINGVLALALRSDRLDPRDREFVQWAARCLSMAIERDLLYDAVVKRNRELDSIKQIGSALASSTFNIKQVLDYTMDMIRVIMNVQAGALYLVKEGELEFAVSFNMTAHQRKPIQLKLGQGIPGYVAARGEPMMVNEGQDTSVFMPKMNVDKNFIVRSALCVPMISQGRVIGVIEVLNKTSGEFVANEMDLLQSIAASVSIAVENANLYQETVTMAENERAIRQVFQKFVPKEVLEKILRNSNAGAELNEELKTLTLLNIDIRGFSGLVKTLGPQKTVSLLNAFFSLMGGIVFKHQGIVDKYLGDGFLAIFGAPVSNTADADNALHAALEMQASLEKINAGLAKEMGVELKIGISVHTGEVVVGNIGFDMKMDYTVIGDPVNDVFRLQDMVSPFPNSIFFSVNTLRATRMALNYIELDERLGQVKIYELLGKAH